VPAINGLTTALFAVAALGYMRLARRLGDRHLGTLALALAVLAFSQLHSVLVPPVSTSYVSVGDGFRLAAYLLLLSSLVATVGREMQEHSIREERLRLSRELHDGLAQELTMLTLRLDQAGSPEYAPEQRHRSLEMARRLAEAALVEARQAISALRTGSVEWKTFDGGVRHFADEYEQNHDLAVHVHTSGGAPAVPADLQVEVMRILNEALSNAQRHGAATRVDVTLRGGAAGLELRVRDNGRGFQPAPRPPGSGVGLESLRERVERRGGSARVESRPGEGAEVTVFVPWEAAMSKGWRARG
jgi:signal transduction histidine kinase